MPQSSFKICLYEVQSKPCDSYKKQKQNQRQRRRERDVNYHIKNIISWKEVGTGTFNCSLQRETGCQMVSVLGEDLLAGREEGRRLVPNSVTVHGHQIMASLSSSLQRKHFRQLDSNPGAAFTVSGTFQLAFWENDIICQGRSTAQQERGKTGSAKRFSNNCMICHAQEIAVQELKPTQEKCFYIFYLQDIYNLLFVVFLFLYFQTLYSGF